MQPRVSASGSRLIAPSQSVLSLRRSRSVTPAPRAWGSRSSSSSGAASAALAPRLRQQVTQGVLGAIKSPFLRGLVPGLFGYVDRTVHPGEGAVVLSKKSWQDANVDMRYYAAENSTKLTMVFFTGNACTADNMDPFAQMVRKEGLNLIVVNNPGTGASSMPTRAKDTELLMIANKNRVRRELHDRGVPDNCVLWAGYSLGGSQAVKGFEDTPGSDLALAYTFTSARAVVGRVVSKAVGKTLGTWLTNKLADKELPVGHSADGVDGVTDGLDTAANLARCAERGEHRAANSHVYVFAGAVTN